MGAVGLSSTLWALICFFLKTALTDGPCGDNMIYKNGVCFCPRRAWNKDSQMFVAYKYSIYNEKCYAVYSQGDCGPNHWVSTKAGPAQCEFNPCAFQTDYEDGKYALYNGLCAKLNRNFGSQCRGKIKLNNSDGLTPVCVDGNEDSKKHTESFLLTLGAISSIRDCAGGQVRSFDGKCYDIAFF